MKFLMLLALIVMPAFAMAESSVDVVFGYLKKIEDVKFDGTFVKNPRLFTNGGTGKCSVRVYDLQKTSAGIKMRIGFYMSSKVFFLNGEETDREFFMANEDASGGSWAGGLVYSDETDDRFGFYKLEYLDKYDPKYDVTPAVELKRGDDYYTCQLELQ